jgi:hypothetical protein
MSPLNFFRPFLPSWIPTQSAAQGTTEGRSARYGGALDAILLVGPDLPGMTIQQAQESCSKHHLAIETLYTADAGSIENLRLQVHAGGKLGAHTQLMVFCHGTVDGHGQHRLAVLEPAGGVTTTPTMEVLRSLRVADDAQTHADDCRKWPGTIHLFSCHGGQLETELVPGSDAWAEGSYLVHASQDVLLVHEGMHAMTDVFASLARSRDAGAAPDPRQMLGYTAHRAGDGVMLLGSAVTAAASFGRPRLTAESFHALHSDEWLKTRSDTGYKENQTLSGLRTRTTRQPSWIP